MKTEKKTKELGEDMTNLSESKENIEPEGMGFVGQNR